ncbi:hypothetical protein [Natrinema altunense]|uniref:DUF4013 domain-containing protein n=1 Tax=Natrinema altunense TaxID=222984 RepID=A0A482Y438_9EURY|nr:hypothetical protein [Natrinema altunense]RZH69064.1 hypothetical protein ELS17_06325 [Natrinema altunense]
MAPAPGSESPPDDDPPTAADGVGSKRSRPFQRHVARVIDRFGDLQLFGVVPLIAALFEFEKVRRALESTGRGLSLNLEFAFPSPLVTLWQLVDPPDPAPATTRSRYGEPSGAPSFGGTPGEPTPTGGSTTPAGATGSGGTDVTIETPVETVEVPLEALTAEMLGWFALTLAAYAVLSGILMAAYVGGLDRRLRGEPIAVGSCVATYAPRFVLYNLVLFGAFLLGVPVFVLQPVLLVLAIPVIVALGYVFYPVPFLFVAADAPFLEAFRRSLRLTMAGGAVLSFALWHLGTAAVASLGLSLLVSGGGAAVLLALLASAPLSLVLTAATVSFFREDVVGGAGDSAGGPSSGDPGAIERDGEGWAAD